MAKKYSDKLKLKIVKEYLEKPLGYKRLAKKYNIPSTTPIKNWVKAYQHFGQDGIRSKASREVYSLQFKLDVLQFKKQTGSSCRDTAFKFKLNHPAIVSNWDTIFLNEGIEGLKGKTKGCASMSQNQQSKPTQTKPISREKELEREIELLTLEVAYLKKLKAFQKNPDAYLEKHKQLWHMSLSKTNLN